MKRFIILLLLGASCTTDSARNKVLSITPATLSKIAYASGFKVSQHENAKVVDVLYPFQGATKGYRYVLIHKGESVPQALKDERIIFTPLESIVCTSTTHIPLLDYLNETDKLVGFTSTDYISSEKMRRRVDEGKVKELGVDKGINLEQLAVLRPSLVMGYTMSSDYGQFKKIEELKIPVIINGEYLEKHPLGRAEWIKFMSLFFEKEELADSVFNQIEQSYTETKKLVETTKHRPSVISGIVYGDAWFMPGGQNYASIILKDAGCNYLWSNDPTHGFLQIPFEKVYEKGHNADLWIGTGTYGTLDQIAEADHRYTNFRAFKEKKVFNYDARQGAKGGSEFLELGYLRPDIILKDLVKIAHPELTPEYELFFHRRLE